MHKIDKFLNYESENVLFSKNVEGFYFWGYIRFYLYSKVIEHTEELRGQTKGSLTLFNKFKFIKSLFIDSIFHNPFLCLKESDYLFINHPRRIKNGYFYECIYTDLILEKMSDSYTVLENQYNNKHFKPINTKNIKFLDWISIISNLGTRLIKKENQSKELQRMVKNIVLDLNQIYNIDLNLDEITKYVVKLYKMWIIQKKLLRNIVKKVNPKCIVEVCYYSFSNLVVNEIANEMNINTIELQHGTMGKYHIAYNFKEKQQHKFLPKKIYLFSDYWKQVSRLPMEDNNVIVTGFPYLERKVNNEAVKSDVINETKTIIFVSQLTIGKYLSIFAASLVKELEKHNLNYNIIYKLHMTEIDNWEKAYPWLAESKGMLKVIDNNEKSIYEYFSISDIQIGVYSTALFEGLAFNLDTYLLNCYGIEYMDKILASGYARLIKDVDQLIEYISHMDMEKQKSNTFWKDSSLENILKELGREIDV